MNLASWLDNHRIDEKVFHMESHDFNVHWVETLYATCWSFGVFFKFGGKITNNIYQIICWCARPFSEIEHLQILSKDDDKYLIWQLAEKKAARIQKEVSHKLPVQLNPDNSNPRNSNSPLTRNKTNFLWRLVLKKTVFLHGRVRWIWVWSTRLIWYVCRLWDMVFSWRFER